MIGLILAAAVQLVLYDWSQARFGSYDSENLGVTALLPAVLVASAVFAFASLIAPVSKARPSMFLTVTASTVAGLIIATNIPGALNGFGLETIPLALVLLLAAFFALWLLWRTLREVFIRKPQAARAH